MADAHLTALRSSVARLHDLAAGLDEEELTGRAYPSEWSVADVLSHLGSGAVITRRRLDDTLTGSETPDDFAPVVWDEWNAKPPLAQRNDALAADVSLLASLDAVPAEQRSTFTSEMGPMTLDFAQFVAMRLNEHAFHTWDIEVAGNPTATIPQQASELIVDNLDLIARFTATPTGDTTMITVATTDPARRLLVELTPESVTFGPSNSDAGEADLRLTAESFARFVYGRLDPAHTPAGDHGPALDVLRQVFPGP
ncbi:MAG: maleylpyruvate isomerase family mycothiol-dependent enzyme [Microthrixaceae bacterium]|nr:maleylpyruvate isomerase family mycothiol-dependent enzyme [Microthrixaceae bacterium]